MAATVALVLGSGGARGYTHIGVIEEIERRGYQIKSIAGCSMGAVVGGVYAAGKLNEYREWVSGLDYLSMLRLLDLSFGNLGAIRGEKIFGRIKEMLGEINIEDLPIDFTAVATDLAYQQEVWFQQGCLHHAIHASAAIPSLFAPVRQAGRVLVDGGLLNPLPINPVVAMHCDLIMAVDLNSAENGYGLPNPAKRFPLEDWANSLGLRQLMNWRGQAPEAGENANEPAMPQGTAANDPSSMLELINLALETMQTSLTRYKIAGYPPDVVFNVPRRLCRFYEFHRAPELIEVGRQIASDTLDAFEAARAK